MYLLGRDSEYQKVWLEAPQWECEWYWGFGYVERYQSNRSPSLALGISSHSHWSSDIVGKKEFYDHEKECFRQSSDYRSHLNDNKDWKETVLTDDESWRLAELIKTCYRLREAAETFWRGGSHVSSDEAEQNIVTRKRWANEINQKILPALFKEIDALLSPAVV